MTKTVNLALELSTVLLFALLMVLLKDHRSVDITFKVIDVYKKVGFTLQISLLALLLVVNDLKNKYKERGGN